MLTVKQVFELARDGAFEQYNSAIKYGSFTLAKQVF